MPAKESLVKKEKLAYSFSEASDATGYSQRTISQAVADGDLIARYANSKGIIKTSDLLSWIDSLPTEKPE